MVAFDHAGAVSARSLRAVESFVRHLYGTVRAAPDPRGDDGNSNAGSHVRGGSRVLVQDVQVVDRLAQLVGHLTDVVRAQIEQSQNELLATIARSDVQGSARKRLHHLRNSPQRLITRLMAVPIVVGFEVVNVDQKE